MESNITCFLIDDDVDDQEIFALALERVNTSIKCTMANDGIEALEKLRGNDTSVPQYIFLDLNMPRVNGKQCLAEIKKDSRLDHIPVIIYSTSSDPRDVDETKQLGATAFITKPSKISDLVKILSDFFDSRIKS
jgi:CheY-like chemotaxis protein